MALANLMKCRHCGRNEGCGRFYSSASISTKKSKLKRVY
jgi:hypothetical protein